ncbi:MAG: glycosyltransferase family 2 protein [Xanthomonadales bacterium]|nr:glycosyltransferase family 2 protein [Xanthomonadales bacterium]
MAADLVAGLTSIIIVAADSGPLLGDAVASALAQDAAVEVLVLDNASRDGEPARVAAAHAADQRLRLVRNGSNLGFGTACNRGAALAQGDALLFQNPDCTLPASAVSGLRRVLAGDARLALVGARVCAPDGKPARGNRRREPSLRRVIMAASGLARLEARWPALAGVEMPAAAVAAAVEEVEAVSGALMLVRREAFDAVGGFDPAYFLHAEDLDLCRRLRDAGWRVAIAGGVPVSHAQGGSSRHRPVFVAWHKHRGFWRYFTRFDPAARNPLLRALVWLALWLRFVLQVPWLWLRRRR